MSGVAFTEDVERSVLVLGEGGESVEVEEGLEEIVGNFGFSGQIAVLVSDGIAGASGIIDDQKIEVIVPGVFTGDFVNFAVAIGAELPSTHFVEVTNQGGATRSTLEPNDDGNIFWVLSSREISAGVEDIEELGVGVGVVDTEVSGSGVGDAFDRCSG